MFTSIYPTQMHLYSNLSINTNSSVRSNIFKKKKTIISNTVTCKLFSFYHLKGWKHFIGSVTKHKYNSWSS